MSLVKTLEDACADYEIDDSLKNFEGKIKTFPKQIDRNPLTQEDITNIRKLLTPIQQKDPKNKLFSDIENSLKAQEEKLKNPPREEEEESKNKLNRKKQAEEDTAKRKAKAEIDALKLKINAAQVKLAEFSLTNVNEYEKNKALLANLIEKTTRLQVGNRVGSLYCASVAELDSGFDFKKDFAETLEAEGNKHEKFENLSLKAKIEIENAKIEEEIANLELSKNSNNSSPMQTALTKAEDFLQDRNQSIIKKAIGNQERLLQEQEEGLKKKRAELQAKLPKDEEATSSQDNLESKRITLWLYLNTQNQGLPSVVTQADGSIDLVKLKQSVEKSGAKDILEGQVQALLSYGAQKKDQESEDEKRTRLDNMIKALKTLVGSSEHRIKKALNKIEEMEKREQKNNAINVALQKMNELLATYSLSSSPSNEQLERKVAPDSVLPSSERKQQVSPQPQPQPPPPISTVERKIPSGDYTRSKVYTQRKNKKPSSPTSPQPTTPSAPLSASEKTKSPESENIEKITGNKDQGFFKITTARPVSFFESPNSGDGVQKLKETIKDLQEHTDFTKKPKK